MAIAKMRKLNLIALTYDKDAILNALHRTNAVEVTMHADVENTKTLEISGEEGKEYLASVEAALDILVNAVSARLKEDGEKKSDVLKDGFDVSYSEFMGIWKEKSAMDTLVAKIGDLTKEKNLLRAELVKTSKEQSTAAIYAELSQSLSAFGDTAHTRGRLGTIEASVKEKLLSELAAVELCDVEIINATAERVLLYVMSHKSVVPTTDNILSAHAFAECPYKTEQSGAEIYRELCEREQEIKEKLQECDNATYALKGDIRSLKIYCDYLAFSLEKQNTDEKLRATEKTFLFYDNIYYLY